MADSSERLETLVRAHSGEVYGVLLAITRNAATAEELTQDVFLLAFRKGLSSGPGMRAWLREVARRLAMNELRRKRPELAACADALPAPSAGGPADASFDEELAALRQCLAELPGPDRTLLAARYERGEPLEKVAADVAQSVGYLKQRLFRLRRRLAECVQRRMGGKEATRA
ncbi:MAG: sigma-70 family RNA polymerase sigma factor [Planctomycetota bacterium]|nr:sigma-70 family RNA polymerase sigma factor [Planctomycetota bacterium]